MSTNTVSDFDDDEDVDDDMADLFSFGAPSNSGTTTTTTTLGALASDNRNPTLIMSSSAACATTAERSTINPRSSSTGPKIIGIEEYVNVAYSDGENDENRSTSGDSFIDMLEHEQQETTFSTDMMSSSTPANRKSTSLNNRGSRGGDDEESDMQEILDWLDADDELAIANRTVDEEEVSFIHPPRPPPTLEESIPKSTSPASPQKMFNSLKEAVASRDSTIQQIRTLLEKENFEVDASIRPHLWSKVICHKTLDETLQSSIADSFQQWEKHYDQQSRGSKNNEKAALENAQESSAGSNGGKDGQETTEQSKDAFSKSNVVRKSTCEEWLHKQSSALATRIVSVGGGDVDVCQRALFSLLMNHYDSGGKVPFEDDDDNADNADGESKKQPVWMDALLPPVACAILSARVPKLAAAVMLSQIIPSFMPILALSMKERREVADVIHRQFYLLACYHLPLLVLHLDKYIPDWYRWPPIGKLPQSWLVSHLAGETDGAFMNPQWLLCLWDLVLTSSNNSLRFFLVIAILDNHAESLLFLTGDALTEEFHKVLTFRSITGSKMSIEPSEIHDDMSPQKANAWIREWSDKAILLWEETPFSVSQKLKTLEDNSVNSALVKRQREKEEQMRLKAEAEAKAYQEALEAERERKAEEARSRLTRARLVAFYREFNPGKEGNIDKILENYKGRYEILDKKLKQKYGVGFNPAIKPKEAPTTKSNNMLLASMNSGFGNSRKTTKRNDDSDLLLHVPDHISVEVSASEVLPVICWSKELNKLKLSKLKKSSKLDNDLKERVPLKFYLVDSRPEAAAEDQGRFPTSVNLSPAKLTDVDNIKIQEEIFEPLRGSVHIIIMGEGYSSLPSLYGHKMTPSLNKLICDDVSRNNECAQFFLSRGFPFVSILEGGFASALAWLYREGPKHHLSAQNVLTDYNVDVSLFGQFERLHNATGREKAQRSLQNLFDSSMAAMTKTSMRLETLASEIEKSSQKPEQTNVVQRFFSGNKDGNNKEMFTQSSADAMADDVEGNNAGSTSQAAVPFRNPFARKKQHGRTESQTADVSSHDLVVESVEFDGDTPVSSPPSDSTPSNEKPVQSPESIANTTPASEGDKQKANPFSGLGAAINASLKAGTKSSSDASQTSAPIKSIPRNPFARFGGGGGGGSIPLGKNPGMAFNQFRKNTMARMMVPGKESHSTQQSTPSKSPDAGSSSAAPGETPSVDDSKATTTTESTDTDTTTKASTDTDTTTQNNSDEKPARVKKV